MEELWGVSFWLFTSASKLLNNALALDANPQRKRWFRSRWLWLALLLVLVVAGGWFYLEQNVTNVMHPALDKLSAISFGERWSHPEMLKIRALGDEAVPPLRRVLREKNAPAIRLLLWVKTKWPGATKYYSHFPDPNKLRERRWTACQALQSLGPAAKGALPEILAILRSNDNGDLNAATMTLHSIGVDADVCDRLDALMERGVPDHARVQIVWALATVKPPSSRTLRVLTVALNDKSAYVQHATADALDRLGARTPEMVSRLKSLQSTSTDELVVITSSATLWQLETNASLVLPPVFQILEQDLRKPLAAQFGGGNGGQGVNGDEQAFMAAAGLFSRMNLSAPDKTRALALLESWCEKSGRIFIRMLLLPAMMDLGFSREKCLDTCRTGLNQEENYYRIQAARLLTMVSDRYAMDGFDLDALIQDKDVGVRVYAAKIHWRKNHQAQVVLPVLIEALDRPKHQSYYYPETLATALTTLRDLGPEAREAGEVLEKTTHDPNPDVVRMASDALTKIRK